MANELDELMSLDPLELTRENIDQIIAYHRQNRAKAESGVGGRPKKEAGLKVDLSQVMANLTGKVKPAVGTVKRRV